MTTRTSKIKPNCLRKKDHIIDELRSQVAELESELAFSRFFLPIDLPSMLRKQAK